MRGKKLNEIESILTGVKAGSISISQGAGLISTLDAVKLKGFKEKSLTDLMHGAEMLYLCSEVDPAEVSHGTAFIAGWNKCLKLFRSNCHEKS